MKNLLLPYGVKKVGWVLYSIGMILGICIFTFEPEVSFFDVSVFGVITDEFFGSTKWFRIFENNVLDELTALLIIFGGLFVAFSRQKVEDEYISKVRLDSLLWATYVNYAVLILGIIFVYDMPFFWVLIFNMFTILFIFIIRFYWVLNKTNGAI